MPLHSAVYEPGRDFIYAVRGGTVFKLNATTGKAISSSRFGGPDLSDSYIEYDSGRDKLWVTYSPSFKAPPGNAHPTNDTYIYKLNVDTFAIEQTIGIGQNLLDPSTEAYQPNNVIRHIRSNGVQLACWMVRNTGTNGTTFIVFNPDSLPGSIFNRNFGTSRWAFLDIVPSSTNYFFCTDDHFNSGVQEYTDANVFVDEGGCYPIVGSNASTLRIYGFAYVASSDQDYCANRSNLILKLDASNVIVGSAIDTGRTAADIWNIRRNSVDGKLYAPTFTDNAVVVIDPNAGDSVTVKTGFDSPWDVVFTPTKKWAIQHSAIGLKEIV